MMTKQMLPVERDLSKLRYEYLFQTPTGLESYISREEVIDIFGLIKVCNGDMRARSTYLPNYGYIGTTGFLEYYTYCSRKDEDE